MNLYTLHENNVGQVVDELNHLLLNKKLVVSEFGAYDRHIETGYRHMIEGVLHSPLGKSIMLPIGLGIYLPYVYDEKQGRTTVDICGDIMTAKMHIPHIGDIHTDIKYYAHLISITAFRSLDES